MTGVPPHLDHAHLDHAHLGCPATARRRPHELRTSATDPDGVPAWLASLTRA